MATTVFFSLVNANQNADSDSNQTIDSNVEHSESAGKIDFGGIEQFVNQRPQQVKRLFEQLDLAKPQLKPVADAVKISDYVAAARELLKYFDQKQPLTGLALTTGSDPVKTADRILVDSFTERGQDLKLERDADGNIVWGMKPYLGRHFHLMELLEAYKRTSKPEYIERLNKDLWDWFNHMPFPAEEIAKFNKGTWAHPSNANWNTLEAGIRLSSWVRLWQNWQGLPISDEVRLLMLMSLPEHCNYLRWHHRHTGNWKVSEMTGISETAIAFDEFANSDDWLEYGLQELGKEIDNQFYPDGAQKELAFHYNRIVVRKMNSVANLAIANQIPISQSYIRKIENLYRYMAYVMTPDGFGPMNSDSDRDFILPIIRGAARQYRNEEFAYIASRGQQGSWKQNSYSVLMPWAGQAIFRSGFGENDDWSYFEIGPWGIAHQHYDKLHLSVMVGGRDILVDSGRYTYEGYHDTTNPWRNYFIGSDSHNVILIDGIGQGARERMRRSPISNQHYLINEEFAFARGKFDSGFSGVKDKDKDQFAGEASHTRGVLYVPEFGWIVVDHIDTDRPRSIDVMWRFHPECTVQTDGLRVSTRDEGKGNLMILPAGEYALDLNIVKGRNPPEVQGWYSERYGIKFPNSVAIYNGRIEDSATLVWWLIPRNGEEEPGIIECSYVLDAESQKLTFSGRRGDQRLEAVIPIRQGHPEVVLETAETTGGY